MGAQAGALLVEVLPKLAVVGSLVDSCHTSTLTSLLRQPPDVVVMGIRMPILDGLEATRRLIAEPVPPRVLELTTFDLDENLSMTAGASGFLLKDVRRGQLAAAIRAVMLGDALIDPQVTRRLIERFCLLPTPVSGTPEPLRSLTERELEVLRPRAQKGQGHRGSRVCPWTCPEGDLNSHSSFPIEAHRGTDCAPAQRF
ncbi:MAG TPA: response regulator transcription factor [Dermatophilaceae bacterium]|nr:response regulator transcription factor [Dermatophilaceae bacterium]